MQASDTQVCKCNIQTKAGCDRVHSQGSIQAKKHTSAWDSEQNYVCNVK